eukprot:2138451-Pyramimonas_sp.AAC.1
MSRSGPSVAAEVARVRPSADRGARTTHLLDLRCSRNSWRWRDARHHSQGRRPGQDKKTAESNHVASIGPSPGNRTKAQGSQKTDRPERAGTIFGSQEERIDH